MKRLFAFLLLVLLIGCRQEDWAEVTLPCPPEVSPQLAVSALRALDRETPPHVVAEGGQLHIRYNSMRVSTGNFRYTLRTLAEGQQAP